MSNCTRRQAISGAADKLGILRRAARTAAPRGRIHDCTRIVSRKVRFFSLAARAPSIHDPSVWSGRAMQEVSSAWMMWSCVTVSGLWLERLAPGHHGYQRACDLILGQASNGLFGSPRFARAGKTDHSIVVSSSRRPRRVTLVKLSASTFLASCCSFVCAGGRSFVPACGCTGAPRAGPVKAGRRDNIATCASVCRPRLDGPEHGARIKQIGTLLHWP